MRPQPSGTADKFPLSRCGIYCGACYVYRAERDCGEFIREVAGWQKVDLNEVRCNSCFAVDEEKWPNCRQCNIKYCIEEKGYVYCHECDKFWDYSCEQFNNLEAFCSKREEAIKENLIKIMIDASKWLEEQKKKWRCSSCGKPYSWYEEICHHCGKKLNRSDLRH